MKELEVVEYKLTGNSYITGWALHRLSKRPDLQGIQMPTPEMNKSLGDANGKLKYQLVDNAVVVNIQEPTEHETALQNFNRTDMYRIIKALVSEIDALRAAVGGNNTARYAALKNIIDRIDNV
jgi:hypothetical protein